MQFVEPFYTVDMIVFYIILPYYTNNNLQTHNKDFKYKCENYWVDNFNGLMIN